MRVLSRILCSGELRTGVVASDLSLSLLCRMTGVQATENVGVRLPHAQRFTLPPWGDCYFSTSRKSAREMLVRASFRERNDVRRMLKIPGLRNALDIPRERRAVIEAEQFVRARRRELGVSAPRARVSYILSCFGNPHYRSGCASALDRSVRISDSEDRTRSHSDRLHFYVHEISHAFGVLQWGVKKTAGGRRQSGSWRLCPRREGCVVFGPRSSQPFFLALEEFAASTIAQAHARSKGATVEAFVLPVLPKRAPRWFLRKAADIRATLLCATDEPTGDPPNEGFHTPRVHHLTSAYIKHEGKAKPGQYGVLCVALQKLATEIYPELTSSNADARLQQDVQRIQAGASHAALLRRMRSAFGRDGVRFIARLGATSPVELFDSAPSMLLLSYFAAAQDLPIAKRPSVRGCIVALARRWHSSLEAPTDKARSSAVSAILSEIAHDGAQGHFATVEILLSNAREHKKRFSPREVNEICTFLHGSGRTDASLFIDYLIERRLLQRARVVKFRAWRERCIEAALDALSAGNPRPAEHLKNTAGVTFTGREHREGFIQAVRLGCGCAPTLNRLREITFLALMANVPVRALRSDTSKVRSTALVRGTILNMRDNADGVMSAVNLIGITPFRIGLTPQRELYVRRLLTFLQERSSAAVRRLTQACPEIAEVAERLRSEPISERSSE